jgi:rhodanese-related sulfurtransferase
MHKTFTLSFVVAALLVGMSTPAAAQPDPRPVLDDAIVKESSPGPARQVSTSELRALIASGEAVLLDARPPEEYGMSHIPGALNVAPKAGVPISVYVSDVAEIKRLVVDPYQLLVLYCNGPFCGKSKRLADEIAADGFFQNVRRYQLGMPGWRTAGGLSVIEFDQLMIVKSYDRTAVFVDAGLSYPIPGRSVRILPGQVAAAKDDGRLPMHDHNTRIIVMAATPAQARAVAQDIAANAFHNVSYYDGSGDRLEKFSRQPW